MVSSFFIPLLRVAMCILVIIDATMDSGIMSNTAPRRVCGQYGETTHSDCPMAFIATRMKLSGVGTVKLSQILANFVET